VKSRASQLLRSHRACATALIAAAALLGVPAGASAASPVLEFVVPGHSLPVKFTTESGPLTAEMAGFTSLVHCTASSGEGEITGPRSTVSEYRFTGCVTEGGSNTECQSAGAGKEEIRTGPIEADLVYINQAKHEVAMLLDPDGGTYIAFDCGAKSAEGRGPFLAPVSPINTEASVFTATLSQSGSMQTPDEYEGAGGEKLTAIPMGEHDGGALVTTGVEATFTVHPSAPGYIRAISAVEVLAEEHARQVGEEAKRQEEEAATKKHQEEAATAAAVKKHQEEEALAMAAATKKNQEEVAAVAKKYQEEEKLKSKPTRAQLLTKALKQCKKAPKHKRGKCETAAKKKYGHKGKKK
jgi:hypothetical protein